jgi:hypothetical protein
MGGRAGKKGEAGRRARYVRTQRRKTRKLKKAHQKHTCCKAPSRPLPLPRALPSPHSLGRGTGAASKGSTGVPELWPPGPFPPTSIRRRECDWRRALLRSERKRRYPHV